MYHFYHGFYILHEVPRSFYLLRHARVHDNKGHLTYHLGKSDWEDGLKYSDTRGYPSIIVRLYRDRVGVFSRVAGRVLLRNGTVDS